MSRQPAQLAIRGENPASSSCDACRTQHLHFSQNQQHDAPEWPEPHHAPQRAFPRSGVRTACLSLSRDQIMAEQPNLPPTRGQ